MLVGFVRVRGVLGGAPKVRFQGLRVQVRGELCEIVPLYADSKGHVVRAPNLARRGNNVSEVAQEVCKILVERQDVKE